MVVRRHLLCDAAALPPSLAQIGINCRRQAPTGPKSDFFTASCPGSSWIVGMSRDDIWTEGRQPITGRSIAGRSSQEIESDSVVRAHRACIAGFMRHGLCARRDSYFTTAVCSKLKVPVRAHKPLSYPNDASRLAGVARSTPLSIGSIIAGHYGLQPLI